MVCVVLIQTLHVKVQGLAYDDRLEQPHAR